MYRYDTDETVDRTVSAIFLNVKQYKNEARFSVLYTFRDGYVLCRNGASLEAPEPGTKEAEKFWKKIANAYLKKFGRCMDLTEMLSVSYFSSRTDFLRCAKGSKAQWKDNPMYIYHL